MPRSHSKPTATGSKYHPCSENPRLAGHFNFRDGTLAQRALSSSFLFAFCGSPASITPGSLTHLGSSSFFSCHQLDPVHSFFHVCRWPSGALQTQQQSRLGELSPSLRDPPLSSASQHKGPVAPPQRAESREPQELSLSFNDPHVFPLLIQPSRWWVDASRGHYLCDTLEIF